MGELGSNDQTSDGSRGQGRENTGNQGRQGKSRDVTATGRGQLAQNTNLDTQRANVAEAAEGVGGNELGARRHLGVVWIGGHGVEGIVLILQATTVIITSQSRGTGGTRDGGKG